MNKNEVIILSSDDEDNDTHQNQSTFYKNKKFHEQYAQKISLERNMCNISSQKKPRVYSALKKIGEKIDNSNVIKISLIPEVVDLEEVLYLPSADNEIGIINNNNVDCKVLPNLLTSNTDKDRKNYVSEKTNSINEKKLLEIPANELVPKSETNVEVELDNDSNSENSFFKEFVNLCASLEPIPTDRARLKKKLYKRYNEANPEYLKSEKFKNLVKKCKERINANNLYLLAKEISDDLSSRKKIDFPQPKTDSASIECKENKNDDFLVANLRQKNKKQRRIIRKIIKRLDMLGLKIRELEEAEVDLRDEEASSYLQLQRYRYRFWMIYKKLCEYTNEVPDANRMYTRKICFSGSKYPEINKSIEQWLNKTKRFPDFTDIMKLVENHSSSIGLPSEIYSIKILATEIFQKVGMMLKQRRQYDLWDSFCEYLDESEDPANNNPELEKVLKQNYQKRMAKEQEIIAHYVEIQEKERLKPEEVPEESAFDSPTESGNEDEKEIEEAENSINKIVDLALEKEGEVFESNSEQEGNSKTECIEISDSESETESTDDSKVSKETKNNFKNCKSSKWRQKENLVTSKFPDSSLLTPKVVGFRKTNKDPSEAKDGNTSESLEPKTIIKSTEEKIPMVQIMRIPIGDIARKNDGDSELRPPLFKKRKVSTREDSFKAGKSVATFEIRFCHVEYNFKNFCKSNYEQGLSGLVKTRNIFQNLTNVSCLLDKNKMRWRFPKSYYRRWDVGKPKSFFPKKELHINCKSANSKEKKCASDQGEKIEEGARNRGDKPKGRGRGKNWERKETRSYGFGSGQGNGNDRENDENDENKKRKKKDGDEGQNEEEDEEDDEETDKKTEEDKKKSEGENDEAAESTGVVCTPEIAFPEMPRRTRVRRTRKKDDAKLGSTNAEPRKKREYKRRYPSLKASSSFGSGQRGRRNQWKRRTSLVSAETSIGENIVKAEVTLDEKLSFSPYYNSPQRRNWTRPTTTSTYGSSHDSGTKLNSSGKRNSSLELSDEERVKRFLLNSPSSISITPPKTMTYLQFPSQATLEALATLKKLKGISTSLIRKVKKSDDVEVVKELIHSRSTGSPRKKAAASSAESNGNLPAESDVNMTSSYPKIVTVRGNAPEFQQASKSDDGGNTSTIRISSVWGNCGKSFSRKGGQAPKKEPKKKGGNGKKAVEYVELD